MTEKLPQSPESKSSDEIIKRSSPERRGLSETSSEELKSQAETERTARETLDDLHKAKEQEKPIELMDDTDRIEKQSDITKEDKQRAFTHTLKHVQSKLPGPSKRFSKVIHNKTVERASELMERTVARPAAVLGGALFATIGLATMSFFARRYGFALSGTELILFVSAGWLLGLVSELIWRKLIKRN